MTSTLPNLGIPAPGAAEEVRFISAPLRGRVEAVADAMQAGGVLLFKNFYDSVEVAPVIRNYVEALAVAPCTERCAICGRVELDTGAIARINVTQHSTLSGRPSMKRSLSALGPRTDYP